MGDWCLARLMFTHAGKDRGKHHIIHVIPTFRTWLQIPKTSPVPLHWALGVLSGWRVAACPSRYRRNIRRCKVLPERCVVSIVLCRLLSHPQC